MFVHSAHFARGLLAAVLLACLGACGLPEPSSVAIPVDSGSAPTAPPVAGQPPAPVPDDGSVIDGSTKPHDPRTPGPVARTRKANYGHYFALRYSDTAADVAMLCEQPGVKGVVWRQTWREVEPARGAYDFSSFDEVLNAIGESHNPQCQLWLFVEFKSFGNSPLRNPCPAHLQASHSGPNAHGHGASTCFMWEPEVVTAYVDMLRAAAARYDAHPRVEGFVIQESALGFNGAYSQDVGDGGTYTATAWRDALIEIVEACGAAFRQSRCMSFMNFIRGNQRYVAEVAAAIDAVPDNRACLSGPDVLPDERSLHADPASVYQVLVRHEGCRANSVQNDSYEVPGCGPDCVFEFAVGGTFGQFDTDAPRQSGLCVNSYLMWNHRVMPSSTGLDWTDALPVIAAYAYGDEWRDRCSGGGGSP